MERDIEKYEVEKSKDGNYFTKIDEVKAVGNSDMPSFYSIEDNKNIIGKNYYRIKQIDIDGKFSYSEIATEIVGSNQTEIALFPNPTNGVLNVSVTGLKQTGDVLQYTITDLQGKVWIKNSQVANGINYSFSENLSNLPNGMYFIQIGTNGFSQVKKLVKTN